MLRWCQAKPPYFLPFTPCRRCNQKIYLLLLNSHSSMRLNINISQYSMRNLLNSDWKVGLEVRVRCASVLMSSREQSREMRTISHKAPSLIISFAFTSAIMTQKYQVTSTSFFQLLGQEIKASLPCCAKWHNASSMCLLMGAASLLALFTIQGSAPSSIKRDFPTLFPVVIIYILTLISNSLALRLFLDSSFHGINILKEKISHKNDILIENLLDANINFVFIKYKRRKD